MADNKIFVRRRSIRGNEYCLAASGGYLDTLKIHVEELRDAFRAGFSDGTRYVVSDIAQWTGVTGAAGLAFIFRDKTKGCEWLFMFGCRTDTASILYTYNYAGNGSGATLGGYFQTISSTTVANPTATNSSNGMVHFNYSYAGSTYAMGFTDTSALTYGSGDYQAPASSPYSALSSFMPSATGRTKGVDFALLSASNAYNRMSFLYYPEKGSLCFDLSFGGNLGAFTSFISGKEIYPTNANGGLANVSDTRQDGWTIIQRYPSGSLWSTIESSFYMHNFFVRDDGTTIEHEGRPANIINDFNRSNYLSGGLVQKRKLQISVSGYIKGYLDPEIVNESFPYNDVAFKNMRLALPDSDNPMIKDHPQITRFWKKDLATFESIPDAGLPID